MKSMLTFLLLILALGQEKKVKYDLIQPTASEYMIVEENVSENDVKGSNHRQKGYEGSLLKEIRLFNENGDLTSFGHDQAIVRFTYYETGNIKSISLFDEDENPATHYVREYFKIKYYFDGGFEKKIEFLTQDGALVTGSVDHFSSYEKYYKKDEGYIRRSYDENGNLLSETELKLLPCIPYLTCARIGL